MTDDDGKPAASAKGESRLPFLLAQAPVGKPPERDAAPRLPASGQSVPKLGSAPRVLSRQEPQYSEEARKAKVSAEVMLSLVVAEDGKAHDIHVVKPAGFGLDEKAVEGVGSWSFEPGTRDGKPVPVRTQVSTYFRILGVEQQSALKFSGADGSRPVLLHGQAPSDRALLPGEHLEIAFDVDQQGNVQNARLQSGPPGVLHEAAVDAVRKWKFEPARHEGIAVMVSAVFELRRDRNR